MTKRKIRLREIQQIISAHSSDLPEGGAEHLSGKFANMLADDGWEEDEELPSLVALRAFLLMLICTKVTQLPEIGTNGRGSITAVYRVGYVRYTYDFYPSGRVVVSAPNMLMTPTHWRILAQLDAGTLEWGAAVNACWSVLVMNGYVERHFGKITQKGKDALNTRKEVMPDDTHVPLSPLHDTGPGDQAVAGAAQKGDAP